MDLTELEAIAKERATTNIAGVIRLDDRRLLRYGPDDEDFNLEFIQLNVGDVGRVGQFEMYGESVRYCEVFLRDGGPMTKLEAQLRQFWEDGRQD